MSCSKTTEGGLMRRRKLKLRGKRSLEKKGNNSKRSLKKKKTTRLERQDLYVLRLDRVHLRHTLGKKKRMNTATTNRRKEKRKEERMNTATTNRSHRCLEIKSLITKSTMCCLISDDPCTPAPLPLLHIFQ